jgi:hypothetical protein
MPDLGVRSSPTGGRSAGEGARPTAPIKGKHEDLYRGRHVLRDRFRDRAFEANK